jgi:beta-glucanase (GH16 family)
VHLSRLLALLFCVVSLCAGPETSLKLVWSDEFNDKEIDKKKWNISDGVRIVDGQLSLEIIPGSKPMFWRGSNVHTRGKYSSKAGYIEASIMFVQTGGHGCGFGIGNEDERPPSAGMGFSNGGGNSVGLGLYVRTEDRPGGRGLNPKENPMPKDDSYSKKFHRFGFQWGPADYRWYVDGRLAYTIRISPNIPATPKPMFISLSHNGLPEAGLLKNFKDPKMGPEPMRVDWVKVYQ